MKYIFSILILFSFNALAVQDYKCTITNASAPGENGELEVIGDKSVIGKLFTVNRKTGDMSGPIKNNYLSTPKVIDHGSKENSYKVISIMQNETTSNVYTLVIEEYAESSRKPFVYLSNSWVFYGFCEHF